MHHIILFIYMFICDIMIYYYIIMVVYVCLRFWYSCGLVATLYSRIIPILHNAIFGDLRHFYIFMCIFLCLCCKIVYIRQIRKAGTRKNTPQVFLFIARIDHLRNCAMNPGKVRIISKSEQLSNIL